MDTALQQFKDSVKMATSLLSIERAHFCNPPNLSEQKAVQGLRGGAAVLCVAAFENFLRQLMEEQLGEIKPKINLKKLPEKIFTNSVYKGLESAMRSPLYQPPLSRKERLPNIEKTCNDIIAGYIDPLVFCDVGSNPNSKNVRSLFSNIALDNIFDLIKPKFDSRWKSPTSATFIPDKLDEIVNRRHVVAHRANALNITRTELKQATKFLTILATLLDSEMRAYIKHLFKTCV
jgi:hypothetical protein